jgi:hypothetical protein
MVLLPATTDCLQDFGSAPGLMTHQLLHATRVAISDVDDHKIIPAVDDHVFGLERK